VRFYIASSFTNKEKVQELASLLKKAGWMQTYDWTQNDKEIDSKTLSAIGQMEKKGIEEADLLILLLPGGSGSHIEMGIALALGKPVFLCHQDSELTTTFYHLPGVTIFQGDTAELGAFLVESIQNYSNKI
jgi:nucleoside 2-deoxyribosyltransferase